MLHDIVATHTQFLNKLHNLIILLSFSDMESRIRSILKDVSDIANVLRLKGSDTLKLLGIYQYLIIKICEIILWMIL